MPTRTSKQQRELETIKRLADTSTLKRLKQPHKANIPLFDDFHQLKRQVKELTYHEVAMMQWMRERVLRGEFSEFPGQRHQDGATDIHNRAMVKTVSK